MGKTEFSKLTSKKSLIMVYLDTVYFVETEKLLLKVL